MLEDDICQHMIYEIKCTLHQKPGYLITVLQAKSCSDAQLNYSPEAA